MATRAILHPEIVIGRPNEDEEQIVFRPPATGNDAGIRILDREQERLAKRLDGGYRVIRGGRWKRKNPRTHLPREVSRRVTAGLENPPHLLQRLFPKGPGIRTAVT